MNVCSPSVETTLLPVKNNIVSLMNELESGLLVEANKKKYSTAQYKDIEFALNRIDEKIRVVSFNVLFSGNDHKPFVLDQNKWVNRQVRVISAINAMNPDILGVQEPYPNQIEDLKEALLEYDYFGGADASGMNHGIFYKKDRFECLRANTYPLESQDDEYQHVVDDPFWQSYRKILIHTALMDKTNLKIIHVFNAHLSFFHPDWREMEAKVINRMTQNILKKEKLQGEEQAAVLIGDWNTFSNRPDIKLPAFDGHRVLKIIKGEQFVDTRDEALLGHVGPFATFTNDPATDKLIGRCTPFNGYGQPGIFLDHILVSKNKVISIAHGVNGIGVGKHFEFPSDHMPVVADILVN